MKTLNKFYDTSVIALALVSVGLAIADLAYGLSPIWAIIDTIIYWIFFFDYFGRFFFSKDKKDFVKGNIPDLIAIIPFNSAFRAFRSLRLLKISKLSKLSKLARIGSVSARGMKKAKTFLNTNGLKYVLAVSVVCVLAGAVGICFAEDMPFTDALWWSFVTATTVGYGDLSPATNFGRIIAALLMLVGIGLIGSLTSTITSFFLKEDAPKTASTDKVDMVLTMYESLSEPEKEMFQNSIK